MHPGAAVKTDRALYVLIALFVVAWVWVMIKGMP